MKDAPLKRANIMVKKSPIQGYGVFAEQPIPAGEIIEECHALRFDEKSKLLDNYLFELEGYYFLPLGCGAIYNHSDEPNAICIIDVEQSMFSIEAKRPIASGEEIFIYYAKNWFDQRHIKRKEMSWRYKLSPLLKLCAQVSRFLIILAVIGIFISFLAK